MDRRLYWKHELEKGGYEEKIIADVQYKRYSY